MYEDAHDDDFVLRRTRHRIRFRLPLVRSLRPSAFLCRISNPVENSVSDDEGDDKFNRTYGDANKSCRHSVCPTLLIGIAVQIVYNLIDKLSRALDLVRPRMRAYGPFRSARLGGYY